MPGRAFHRPRYGGVIVRAIGLNKAMEAIIKAEAGREARSRKRKQRKEKK